ncbi:MULTISPECIES: inovirus-type Gp2 protein [unclassified Serratia (in: enterobacteria)]|uniref:YagK/YfjJ domain-containing protein n=1 Tax=unclassified Serratia (in: enterobacteria) TaxID=2647522 RepID=UPI001CC06E40|nr:MULTISPECIES: inovirus-type Gp2 protein [unclassified Serratia (in: enterobacteria)]UAN51611.1 inovirus-type Gp2 protein [Serratia sp. JSRIV002]UAN57614.1 inovirus-type Gp2 protein [Serratia sp. JSRIV004]
MNTKLTWTPDWFLSSVLDWHTGEMVNRYACLLAIRIDLFYRHHTTQYHQKDHCQLERDIRSLMDKMMNLQAVVGYFWVIEWTEDHHYHGHVVFWLDGNRTQTPYPWAEKAGELWHVITDGDGWHHRCEFKEHYRANINIPVHYNDPDSITNIRLILEYLTKTQQKEGLLLHGCNEVPERPLTGRPRLPPALS